MEKKGVDDFLGFKEAKVSVLVLFSILIVFILTLSMSSVFVSALNITIRAPGNYTLNATTSRNVNITFNSTWNLGGAVGVNEHENVSNCTLYINSTGLKIAWDSVLNITATGNDTLGIHHNISNSSISYMNFTFPADGNYTFGIACLNFSNSSGAANAISSYVFSGNFSVFVDASAPTIFNFTTPLNISSNTSDSTTPTKINFTVNDTGIGLNWTNSTSMNVTIHLGGSKVKNFVYNGSDSLTNLTCSPNTGVSTATSTCNATYLFNSNGTYVINVTAVDALGTFGFSTTTFTVDQIPPIYINFSISGNASAVSASERLGNISGSSGSVVGEGSWAQGREFTAFANFSDNLTRPLEADFQFFNVTSGLWQTMNTTKDKVDYNISRLTVGSNVSVNFSVIIPTGRNEFEGKNVSFRVVVNDTVGNRNTNTSLSHNISFRNITININDTFAPTLAISGVAIEVNGTNTTDTTPTIAWNVTESNRMTSINISVDFATGTGGLGVSACGKFAFYDTTSLAASENAERNRNGTFTVTDDPACTLGNGTHNVSIVAIDSWGNRQVFHHVFSLQSGSVPGLNFSLTKENSAGVWSKSAINNSNITSRVGINLSGYAGVGSSIDKISYFSSCDSTVRVENNRTVIYPFNASSCNTQSANRTLTVTINDTAGNSNRTVLGFLVDNVAPTLTIHNPKDGQTYPGVEAAFNLSALDNDQAINSFGYYLDGSNDAISFNISNTGSIGGAGVNVTQLNTTNLTGTHTIKLTANDSVGNQGNSSVITFTQVGAIDFGGVTNSINDTISLRDHQGYNDNVTNVSLFNASGALLERGVPVDQTLELLIVMNKSGGRGANVTINFNGSDANWNKTDMVYIWPNETTTAGFLRTNYSTNVLDTVFANNSFVQFLSNNNSYFAKVRMVLNASNLGVGGFQLLYFPDEANLKIAPSTANVTQCAFDFSPAHSTTSGLPCWNATANNRSIDIFIPHFSLVGLVNDTTAPEVEITTPATTQTVSSFIPNITVSSDAVRCEYLLNITSTTLTSATANLSSAVTPSNGICTWDEVRFKNGAHNITFNVTDSAGNRNLTSSGEERTFTVSDTTAPNNGTSITSSGATDGATITVNNVNESITNITIVYGTTATALSSRKSQTITATTSPSIGSLGISTVSTATLYYYNVTICDYNSNCNTTSNLTFTQSATAAAAAAAAAADSGGGGGGGGAAAVSTVADSKAQVWQSIPSGSSVTLDVDKSAIAVTSVAVNNVKSDLSGVELEVAALSENPVSTEAAAKVYQYFKINKKNIADADAESFKLAFRVTKAWLTENGLASGDVALYRFSDSKWNELATKVSGTDVTYVNYEANTPGFSSFAVGVKSGVVKEEAPKELPEEAPKEVPKEAGLPEAVEVPKPVEAPSKAPVAWIIAAVVIILGIILIMAYQKQKKKR